MDQRSRRRTSRTRIDHKCSRLIEQRSRDNLEPYLAKIANDQQMLLETQQEILARITYQSPQPTRKASVSGPVDQLKLQIEVLKDNQTNLPTIEEIDARLDKSRLSELIEKTIARFISEDINGSPETEIVENPDAPLDEYLHGALNANVDILNDKLDPDDKSQTYPHTVHDAIDIFTCGLLVNKALNAIDTGDKVTDDRMKDNIYDALYRFTSSVRNTVKRMVTTSGRVVHVGYQVARYTMKTVAFVFYIMTGLGLMLAFVLAVIKGVHWYGTDLLSVVMDNRFRRLGLNNYPWLQLMFKYPDTQDTYVGKEFQEQFPIIFQDAVAQGMDALDVVWHLGYSMTSIAQKDVTGFLRSNEAMGRLTTRIIAVSMRSAGNTIHSMGQIINDVPPETVESQANTFETWMDDVSNEMSTLEMNGMNNDLSTGERDEMSGASDMDQMSGSSDIEEVIGDSTGGTVDPNPQTMRRQVQVFLDTTAEHLLNQADSIEDRGELQNILIGFVITFTNIVSIIYIYPRLALQLQGAMRSLLAVAYMQRMRRIE